MPAGYFDEDDDEGQEFEGQTASGPKNLRSALAKAQKEKSDLEEKLATALKQVEELNSKVKSSSLKDALAEAGLDPKYARFAERDGVEPTKDAVAKWADENKDVYAFLAQRPADGGDDEGDGADDEHDAQDLPVDQLPPELVAALTQGQRLDQSGRPSGSSTTVDQLEGMKPEAFKDRQQLLAALEAMGVPLG